MGACLLCQHDCHGCMPANLKARGQRPGPHFGKCLCMAPGASLCAEAAAIAEQLEALGRICDAVRLHAVWRSHSPQLPQAKVDVKSVAVHAVTGMGEGLVADGSPASHKVLDAAPVGYRGLQLRLFRLTHSEAYQQDGAALAGHVALAHL